MEQTKDIIIREARLYDVPAMARIERDSFDSPWSADEITRDVTSKDPSVYVAIIEVDGEKAGYAEIRNIAGEAQVYNIAIAAEFRKRGLGEKLLTHLIDTAREMGCDCVTLEVRQGNEAAMSLYTKLGFREVGVRKALFGGKEDAVLMNKDLETVQIDVKLE